MVHGSSTRYYTGKIIISEEQAWYLIPIIPVLGSGRQADQGSIIKSHTWKRPQVGKQLQPVGRCVGNQSCLPGPLLSQEQCRINAFVLTSLRCYKLGLVYIGNTHPVYLSFPR